jgi:5-methylcytosine-specific restriction endonuclease McrA
MSSMFDDTPETDPAYAPTPRQQQHWSADPRRSSDYQALRKQFREQCRLQRNPDGSYGLACSICHRPINYTLRHPHPLAFTIDHNQPVRSRPDLALSPGNFRPAHWRCNMSKGGYLDNDADLSLGIPSEDW